MTGLVLMEYVRKKDTSLVPSAGHQLMGLDKCNLLKTHVDDTTIDIEEIVTGICKIKKKKKKRKPIRLRSKSLKRLVGWLFYHFLDLLFSLLTKFLYLPCLKEALQVVVVAVGKRRLFIQ